MIEQTPSFRFSWSPDFLACDCGSFIYCGIQRCRFSHCSPSNQEDLLYRNIWGTQRSYLRAYKLNEVDLPAPTKCSEGIFFKRLNLCSHETIICKVSDVWGNTLSPSCQNVRILRHWNVIISADLGLTERRPTPSRTLKTACWKYEPLIFHPCTCHAIRAVKITRRKVIHTFSCE